MDGMRLRKAYGLGVLEPIGERRPGWLECLAVTAPADERFARMRRIELALGL